MTSNNTNILHNNNININNNNNFVVRDGEKFQECLLKGDHDYESINSQYISKNIIEVEYICLDCGDLKCVYNYLEEDDVL